MRDVYFENDGEAVHFHDAATLARGGDWVRVERLDRDEALAQADSGFRAFVRIYEDRAKGHGIPFSRQIGAEDMLASGIAGRVPLLRLAPKPRGRGMAFPGQRCVYERLPKAAEMLARPLAAQALSQRLVGVCMLRRPDFLSIVGRIGEGFVHKVAAALPLGSEQGEVAEVLLPFRDKLGDIPLRLREEFFARDV